ncbi:MAG TPA: selenobiotic family peptide radical SAM maturase [Candidatus Omnitrophica bacterium]|nr:selenobiotic family peptide radical SAM maturase [Candidatus Omnitrophota bacterium]
MYGGPFNLSNMRTKHRKHNITAIYPLSRSITGRNNWHHFLKSNNVSLKPQSLPGKLNTYLKKLRLPQFLPELAKLEWSIYKTSTLNIKTTYSSGGKFQLNPTLGISHLNWKLSPFLGKKKANFRPKKGQEWILIWKDPWSKKINIKPASASQLLAIKLVTDKISPQDVAKSTNSDIQQIEAALSATQRAGLLIGPRPRIRRNPLIFNQQQKISDKYIFADTFTLQWHITGACDLHCKHCYDRSRRSPLTLKQGIGVLENLKNFCRKYNVHGHICFTGGNPFLYPHFLKLYAEAKERGFSTSILGNPTNETHLKKIIDIQMPGYFQVSLEGLEKHNNIIRGQKHFQKVIKFLKVLRKLHISSAVMLTLTEDNIDQVIPLSEKLKNRADYFTFNRLSQVGEGAKLNLPDTKKYAAFLKKYVTRSKQNTIMGFKDNLINIVLNKKKMPCFDGCTGYGCGAAFNFLTVLPDGETHACRKFPSPVGNVLKQNISEIYESRLARRHRKGSSGCNKCVIRHICGGCLAISYSHGQNIFKDIDPYCFIEP